MSGYIDLRDYFAAAALQGIIAAGPVFIDGPENEDELTCCPKVLVTDAAEEAYRFADAMLKARD